VAVRALTSAQKKLYAAGLPVACFGKLPLYEDFLRVPGGEGARAFTEWLDRGFGLRWGDLGGEAETVARPTRVLFVAPKGLAVCAVLSDSHDRGGLRRFPFALMVEFPVKAIDAGSPAFALGLVPVWTAIEAIDAEVRTLSSAAEFYAAIRARKVVPGVADCDLSDLDRPLAAVTSSAAIAGLVFRTARTAGEEASVPSNRRRLAYRLPGLPGAFPALLAGVFARFVEKNVRGIAGPPSAFLTGDAGDPIALVYRPLDTADVRLISPRAGDATRTFDLTDDAGAVPEAFVERVQADLADATLGDLARYRVPRGAVS
jgi:hypothetical protein